MTSWVAAAPSDQRSNLWARPPMVGYSGALRLSREPANTVTVVGATTVPSPTPMDTPSGSESTVIATVFRSIRWVTESLRPVESVAVRVSSRYEGGSWSGTVNVSSATPDQVPIRCWWHVVADEQWCRTSAQASADAARSPSWGSVAVPEKLTRSPTAQVVPAAGAPITAVGSPPTTISVVAVPEAPWLSVTRSRAVLSPSLV